MENVDCINTRYSDKSMKIIKRSGAEEEFSIAKILAAVTKANQTVEFNVQRTEDVFPVPGPRVTGSPGPPLPPASWRE